MTHPGTVIAVKKNIVSVQIQSTSACAACAAHAKCGFAESKTKTLDIPDYHWDNYHEGDQVTVTIDHTRGLQATWWAYILPAFLLLAVVVILSTFLPEPLVILLTFAALALYILLLFLFRKKLNSKFTLTIEPTT